MSYTLYKSVPFGPGRVGLSTVGYTLCPGGVPGTRVTAGVAEVGTATGVYGASISVPSGFAGSVLWDTGQGGSTVYADDDVNPLADVATGLGTPLPIAADVVAVNGTTFTGPNVPIDKTGHSLAAAGLDAITATEPTGPTASYNFRQLLRWLVMNFNRVNRTPTTLTVKTNAGATSTTQAVTDDGAGTESTGATA